MHDVLYTLIEDAQRYQALAQMADEALSRSAAVSQDEELAAFLGRVAQESQHRAEEAKRLLAQRVAE
jgi:hypothetical protein